MLKSFFQFLFILIIFITNEALATPPKIVVTIKPIYGLVKAVTNQITEPTLLLHQKASPHNYTLKPSDVRKLSNADIIFLVDFSFEAFLNKALNNIKNKNTEIITLNKANGIKLLPIRENNIWYNEGAEHDHNHQHDLYDTHTWLDIKNAISMVKYITEVLSNHDIENASKYKANAEKFINQLNNLDNEINGSLSTIADKNYIVFHDAYQYFEKKYGLNSIGAISINPMRKPSVKDILEIREVIKNNQVRCLFIEPQFPKKIVQPIIENMNIKIGILDGEWGQNNDHENEYIALMKDLSSNIQKCLK